MDPCVGVPLLGLGSGIAVVEQRAVGHARPQLVLELEPAELVELAVAAKERVVAELPFAVELGSSVAFDDSARLDWRDCSGRGRSLLDFGTAGVRVGPPRYAGTGRTGVSSQRGYPV